METAIAAAFKNAGYDFAVDRLYSEIAAELAKKPDQAVAGWLTAKAKLPETRLALAQLCIRYIRTDLSGGVRVHSETQSEGDSSRQSTSGHESSETQVRRAAEPSGTGHLNIDPQSERARPALSQKPMTEAARKARGTLAKELAASSLASYRFPGASLFFETRVADLRGLAQRLSREGGDRLHAAIIAATTLKTIEARAQVTDPTMTVQAALTKQDLVLIERLTNRKHLSFRVREWASAAAVDQVLNEVSDALGDQKQAAEINYAA